MTTATTPRQPAKRAKGKGRAQKISASKYQQLLDSAAEEIGIAIACAFLRGQYDTFAITEKREDYACARAVFKSIGIAAPRKERKTP